MTAVTAGAQRPALQQGVVEAGKLPDGRPNVMELPDYRCGIRVRRVLGVEPLAVRTRGRSATRPPLEASSGELLGVVEREQIAAGPAGPLVRRKSGHLGLGQKQGVTDQPDQQRWVELFLVADIGRASPRGRPGSRRAARLMRRARHAPAGRTRTAGTAAAAAVRGANAGAAIASQASIVSVGSLPLIAARSSAIDLKRKECPGTQLRGWSGRGR